MLDLGPHAGFIWSAYGAVAAVLTGLIVWILADARRQRNKLEELESKGLTRRSKRAAEAGDEAA